MIYVEICIDVFIKLEMQYRRAPNFGLFVLKVTTRAAAASTTTTASTTIANKTSNLFGKPVICNVKKYRLEHEDQNTKGTRSLKVPWPIYQH